MKGFLVPSVADPGCLLDPGDAREKGCVMGVGGGMSVGGGGDLKTLAAGIRNLSCLCCPTTLTCIFCRGGHSIFFSLFAIDGSITFSLLIDFD
jgi:hypothetical protein